MADTATTTTTTSELPWRDDGRPLAERVELLLEAMTLEEKVAQLGSRWVGNDMADSSVPEGSDLNVAPLQDVFAASGTVPLEEASRHGLGHLTRVYGSVPVTVQEGVAELVRQHRVVLSGSRLGIPALVHEECLTGFTAYGATVYPAAIAWGATWDPALVERMALAIGRDMAALGVHQGLSPVLDVVRDYRWGRVEETMGEDPYLVSMLGTAYVRGLQEMGVSATLKHFAAYSASRAARNHGPVSMGPREMADVMLPPFEAAIALGGADSVMNSYSDIDGVPAGASTWLLTEVLRDEWGFDGTVVSDYWAIPFLASMHHVAADFPGAGAVALAAGIDVELPDTLGYDAGLVDLVREGVVAEALVDRAARRLLLAKARLGLLDADWTPEGSVRDAGDVDLDSPDNRALAREMAERSIVLLEQGTALPLAGEGRPEVRRVAVVGPCADDPMTFMGCYAFPNHVLPRHPVVRVGHRGAHGTGVPACGAARGRAGPRGRLRRDGDRPLRVRRGRRGRPWRRRVRGAGGRSRRALRARLLGRGLRRRGPAVAGRPGRAARGAAGDGHSGGRRGGLRSPLRTGSAGRPGRRPRAGVLPR